MKKILVALIAILLTAAYAPTANALVWTLSPDANTLAFGKTVVTGLNQIDFLDTGSQPTGIFGAGFTATGTSLGVKFDSDLYSWDSYTAPVNPNFDGTGYYDAFIVTISTQGFYWDLPQADPTVAGPSTFVWGGSSWSDGILDSYSTAPGNADSLYLTSALPSTFYVSVVLDTKTLPQADVLHPSWGSFHIDNVGPAPVPEPGTFVLVGAGLLGLAIYGKRRMKA